VDRHHGKVSPYRLTAHLVSAFVIFSGLVMTGLRVLPKHQGKVLLKRLASSNSAATARVHQRLRRLTMLAKGLIFTTVSAGALVAGNEAGLIYNEFPKMGGRWIPSDITSELYQPFWRNAFENSAMVQFNHRVAGMSTGACISALWLYVLKHRALLPRCSVLAAHALMGVTALQVALGIGTLLMHVPVHMAVTHQGNAMLLMACALAFWSTLRKPAQASKQLKKVIKAAAKK
jgi:cytochrome c oxidase assembly protein subunit 15